MQGLERWMGGQPNGGAASVHFVFLFFFQMVSGSVVLFNHTFPLVAEMGRKFSFSSPNLVQHVARQGL